jgi:dihydrofolate reductase
MMLPEKIAKVALERCSDAPIIGILSCDLQGIVGNRGKTPWRIPEELKFFRDTVCNGSLIMGRKTFNSMPPSILKGKKNIVFSRKAHQNIPGLVFVSSMHEFKALNLLTGSSPLFMIGGAQIAQLFIEAKLISKFILSKINGVYEGDAFIDLAIFIGWRSEVIYQSALYTTTILTRFE